MAALGALLVATGCGDAQPEWCGALAEQEDLSALVAAVSEEDVEAASDAVEDLRRLADDAPREISDDMDAVVDAVEQVIDLRLADDDVPAAERETERDRVNQRLAQVTTHTAAVSRWAETECGIHLG